MEPRERFFKRKLQIVWNFHNFELIPQGGSKEFFAYAILEMQKKGPALYYGWTSSFCTHRRCVWINVVNLVWCSESWSNTVKSQKGNCPQLLRTHNTNTCSCGQSRRLECPTYNHLLPPEKFALIWKMVRLYFFLNNYLLTPWFPPHHGDALTTLNLDCESSRRDRDKRLTAKNRATILHHLLLIQNFQFWTIIRNNRKSKI